MSDARRHALHARLSAAGLAVDAARIARLLPGAVLLEQLQARLQAATERGDAVAAPSADPRQ